MLFVAVPIGAFALAMRTANRRARRVAEQVRSDGEDPEAGTGDSAPGYVDTER